MPTATTALAEKMKLGCLGAAILVAFADPALAQNAGDLVFFEGNGCSQDIVFQYDSRRSANDNCKRRGKCKGNNDEARSLRIGKGVAAGTLIVVYDSPKGPGGNDDFTQISIANPDFIPPEGYCLKTFETTFDSRGGYPGINVDYIRKNGLDGKISHVLVIPDRARP